MIPNPTNDQWTKKVGKKASWKVARFMEIFQSKLHEIITKDRLPNEHRIAEIYNQWQEIQELGCKDEADLSLDAREAIHDALDEQTKFLLKLSQLDILSVLVGHITKVIAVLQSPQSPLNTIVLLNKEDALLDYYFSKIRPEVVGTKDVKGTVVVISSETEKAERDVIWISLIYRMLCWFMLHDFDKMDVKIVPSDLKGSRMPIYIG